MRILFVIHRFLPYSCWGTEIYTLKLAKALSRRYKVAIFTAFPGEYDGKIYNWEIDGIPVYGVKNEHKFLKNFKETYFYPEIEDIFERVVKIFKPDIVHIQHLLFLSVSIVKKAKEEGLPVFITLHDYWYICPKTQMRDIYGNVCEKIHYCRCKFCISTYLIYYKDLQHKKGNIINRLEKNIGKGIFGKMYLKWWENKHHNEVKMEFKNRERGIINYLNMTNCVISPSKWLLDVYRRNGLSSNCFKQIDNGVNSELFQTIVKTGSSQVRFGFIGAIYPAKGIDIIIKAAKKLRGDFSINIWGRSPPGFEGYEKKLINMGRKNFHIIFNGEIENKKVFSIYENIDILIVPSIWAENSPITIHEALAAKTPVIASNIGGIPELIKDGEYGALFPPGDVNALSRIMQKVINNKEIIEQWSKNIPKIKTIQENAEELENMYRKYIKK